MTNERLIIFTRYPEPGKTKTRMIPALGEVGAANLQRQMTEYTLIKTRDWQSNRCLSLEVYFAGGNESLMQAWLGNDLVYRQQSKGDLGQRMMSALQQSFADQMTKVVMIGIDCPDVNQRLINEAFDQLNHHDLVLGPAADGGYYLVGLSHFIPDLFTDIQWGTSQVFSKTKEIAKNLQLSTYYLSVLHDVDCPKDLHFWNKSLI